MAKPAPQYVTKVSSPQQAMIAIAKLPQILTAAFGRWQGVRIVIEEDQPKRSLDQNRLQRQWCKEAARQGDMSPEEYRAFVKLHFGVPILRRDSDQFREAYDRILRPLAYHQKLELMALPFDFPVTRGMTKAQKTEYLDAMWNHFTGLGFRLTDPRMQGIEQQEPA